MSQKRKLRRAGKKLAPGTTDLGKVLEDFGSLGGLSAALKGMGDMTSALQGVQGKVDNSEQVITALIDDYNTVAFEMEMQRAVNIRLVHEASVRASVGIPVHNLIDKENELRAEYVVSMFVEWLARG